MTITSTIRIAANGDFVDGDGVRFVPHGFNWAPAESRVARADACRENWVGFDANVAERDLARIAEAGGNLIRVFLSVRSFIPRPGELPEPAMRRAEALVRIAGRHGVRVLFGGPDWWEGPASWTRGGDEAIHDDAALDHLVRFWRRFAERFAGDPAVFGYTLRNEQPVGWMIGDARWHGYLRARYGSPRAVGEAWGERVDSWSDCAPPPDRDARDDARLYDYQLAREHAGYRWVRRQVEAIRAGDATHLVTYGGVQTDMPLYRGFPGRPSGWNAIDARAIAPLIDFPSLHWYQLRPDDRLDDGAYRPLGLTYLAETLAYYRPDRRPLLLEEADPRLVADDAYARLLAEHLGGILHWEWLEVADPLLGLDPGFAARMRRFDALLRRTPHRALDGDDVPTMHVDKRRLLTWYADTTRHNPAWLPATGSADWNDSGGWWTDEYARLSAHGSRAVRIEVVGEDAEFHARLYERALAAGAA